MIHWNIVKELKTLPIKNAMVLLELHLTDQRLEMHFVLKQSLNI